MRMSLLKSEHCRLIFGLLLVLIVAGTGLALSFAGHSSAFPQSGAVLVFLALMLGIVDLKFVLGDVMGKEDRRKWRLLKSQNELDIKQLEKLALSQRSQIDQLRLELHKQKSLPLDNRMVIDIIKGTQEKRNRLIRQDVWIGAIGTLVWGFGDLFFTQACFT